MRKNKKLIISILITTIIAIIANTFVTRNKLKTYQNKVDIVIANIVGEIQEKYPEVKEEEIISILNMKSGSLKLGYSVLEKFGIDSETSSINGLNSAKDIIKTNVVTIILLIIAVLLILLIYSKSKDKKIKEIIRYIEEINRKNYNLKIEENSEDELSHLSNELYKITVMLKEQAEASNKDRKALQTSIEDISHQIKTPLTSMSIMLDNIRENPNMDEKTRQTFIYEISRQVEWIKWLVISLLKLAKLDSNTAVFVKKEVDVKQLIDSVIKNLTIPLDIKEQHIIVDGKDSKFIGDYNWQLEALTNIVKNCIEHTPENKNIYIRYEENNFYTKIVIRDEGTGIDKQDVKHIFERFYKGKNASENSIGIGLALAKSIIEKDNGYIICDSKIGEGTSFEIKYMK